MESRVTIVANNNHSNTQLPGAEEILTENG